MSENSENPSLINEDGALPGGSDYPSPRIAVLLGGRSGYFDFPTGWYSAAWRYLSETVIDLGVDLATGTAPGLDHHPVCDSVVVLEPGGGGEAGDAAADDGDLGIHLEVASTSRLETALTPAASAASSGRNVGVWT